MIMEEKYIYKGNNWDGLLFEERFRYICINKGCGWISDLIKHLKDDKTCPECNKKTLIKI